MDYKLPYYMAYPMPLEYDDERKERQDVEYMKSMYPDEVKRILPFVEDECDRMEYEGSMIYDEYPDKYMIYHLSCKIRESMEPEISTQAIRKDFLDELIQVMLCQEISRRRCRRYRCRRYF